MTATADGSSVTFARCRLAITEALTRAGRPLRRKTIVQQLRQGDARHSASVVVKSLAHMTRTGELVNPKDGTGYTFPARASAGELRRIACLAKQLADAAPLALWALPCDATHVADALEQLANTSAAVCHLLG